MTVQGACEELRDYYGKKLNEAVIARIEWKLRPLNDVDIDRVIEWITDNIPRKFDPLPKASHVAEACKDLSISYSEQFNIASEQWYCDACGHAFQYSIYASDEDKLDRNRFDVCPMCGFQPAWTKTLTAYKAQGNLSQQYIAWYDAQKKKCSSNYGNGGVAANGQVKKPFWSRAVVEREIREEKRINIAKNINQLDNAKRWDLKGEL